MYLFRIFVRVEPLDKPGSEQRPVQVSTVLFSILKSHTNECTKVGCPCRDIESELDGLAVDLGSNDGEHDLASQFHDERSVVSDDQTSEDSIRKREREKLLRLQAQRRSTLMASGTFSRAGNQTFVSQQLVSHASNLHKFTTSQFNA